jgi:outer membrane protein OmpA-like peptidoglycan-associated protein
MNIKTLIAAVCVAGLAACASHKPPVELVDARAAYAHAEDGNASKLTPADLHVAAVALDSAERAYKDDAESQKTKDLAYIAQRKAQRAEALGNAAAALAAKGSMDQTVSRTQEAIIDHQQKQLGARDQQLAKKDADLQNQVAATEAERAARAQAEADKAAAEKKAQDAMDALSKSLAVKSDTRGTVITLSGGVLFATNKANILPGAQAQLNQVAEALKTQAEQHITIEGHTDNQGNDAINADLSARRAAAVRDYLVVRGVSANAISTSGLGATRPVADNHTVEGRSMNRRVEIVVAPSTQNATR